MKFSELASQLLANLQVFAKLDTTVFENFVEELYDCKGKIILSGVGKPGILGQLFVAGLRSIGMNAHFVHSSEASHGDMGIIYPQDIVIIISKSGESGEFFNLVDFVNDATIKLLAITMNANSYLARNSDVALVLPTVEELPPIELMPTTSNIEILMLLELIKSTLASRRGFTASNFTKTHPGGKIGFTGISLTKIMHSGEELPLLKGEVAVAEAIFTISSKYLGCAIIVDENQELLGIFTDGDLRRKINEEGLLQKQISEVMTKNPISADINDSVEYVASLMSSHNISQVVICKNNKVLGLLNVNDMLK